MLCVRSYVPISVYGICVLCVHVCVYVYGVCVHVMFDVISSKTLLISPSIKHCVNGTRIYIIVC